MEQLPGKWKNNPEKVDNLPLGSIAHLGDAVYELYIRRKTVFLAPKLDKLHKITTSLVNSRFHAQLLDFIKPDLTQEELNIVRRARNLTLTTSKRKDQAIHRISTSLEALVGYLYLTDHQRLEAVFDLFDKVVDDRIQELIDPL